MSTPDSQYVVTVNHAGTQSMHRIALSQEQTAVIGRSWRSDIVINDEYIDPAHLKLSVDASGALHIADLNTKNGTRLGKQTLKQAVQYTNGRQLQIGESSVSVYNRADAVAPALKRDTVQKLAGRYHSVIWYTLATLAGLAALAITHLLLTGSEITKELAASAMGAAALTALSICIVGGLMSKIFRQKTLFGLHYIFVCWMFFLITLITLVWEIVAFNIEPGIVTKVINEVLYFAIGLFVIFGALSMTSRVARYKRLAIAVVALGLPTAFKLITPMLETDYNAWNDRISMNTVNQPPMFQFKAASSVESHLIATDKLFSKLDKEVDWSGNDSIDKTPTQQQERLQVSEVE